MKITNEKNQNLLQWVPARIALHYTVLPLGFKEGFLQLAIPEDLSREARDELKVTLGQNIAFHVRPRPEIESGIQEYYGVGAGVVETLVLGRASEEEKSEAEIIDIEPGSDPSMAALVNELIADAVKQRASDIHIEPFEKKLRIRYRVDGSLREAGVPEKIRMLAPHLISRIKIMAHLDIGERRLAQDGRIKIRQGSETLDLRVSVLPSSFGEAVVIRILKSLTLLSLEELGFEDENLVRMRDFLIKPHGIILITGPTGSGKTTTLYACLKELNQTDRKIITVEDPVEYKLPGILQMQVHSKIQWTFAAALRAILRHDPDCIMVGEIRDRETAEMAIRAALTGHLVFSTLHTNDAPSAVTRLIDMGIPPYLAASALEGVTAQRLVRKFCANCNGNGCDRCGGAGFYGRFAVSEVMSMNDSLRDLVMEKKPTTALRKAAIAGGMLPLYEEGLRKVRKGLTAEKETLKNVSRGFTLIEVLLVVIIIGVLAALAVPRLAGRSEEARVQAAQADIDGGISLALDLYEVDNGRYPERLEDLVTKPSESSKWKGPYLKRGIPKDPWGSNYVYRFPGTHHPAGYDLASPGPDRRESTEDDIKNW